MKGELKKGLVAINTIIIIVIVMLVLFAILSFVLSTTKPAQLEIALRGEFDTLCASQDCYTLRYNNRMEYLCSNLWGESNRGVCVKNYCAKCTDKLDSSGNIVASTKEATGTLKSEVTSLKNNLKPSGG